MGHLLLSQTNFMGSILFFTGGRHVVSWFDLETCSKVNNDGAILQNTHDFLSVFYSNFGRKCKCQFI